MEPQAPGSSIDRGPFLRVRVDPYVVLRIRESGRRSSRAPMTRLGAWVQASRPLAQISVGAPLVYGQALAFAAYGTFTWRLCVAAHLFGLFDQLFVVYANDVA